MMSSTVIFSRSAPTAAYPDCDGKFVSAIRARSAQLFFAQRAADHDIGFDALMRINMRVIAFSNQTSGIIKFAAVLTEYYSDKRLFPGIAHDSFRQHFGKNQHHKGQHTSPIATPASPYKRIPTIVPSAEQEY